MYRILVTGSCGIGGVNFVRALKIFQEKFFIVGTDFNKFYLQFPDVDVRVNSPKHSDPQFIQLVKNLVQEHKIDFVHPQPSSEALVIAEQKNSIDTKTFLPESSIISKDKLDVQLELSKKGISIAQTQLITNPEKIDENEMGHYKIDSLIEFPVTLMDAYLFTYMKLSEDEILPTIKKTLDYGRNLDRVNNVITILWHDNVLKMKGGRMYKNILEFLTSQDDVKICKGEELVSILK